MAEHQEANLKRVLGLTDALGMAVGIVIGAGVLVVTGIAIGLTGKGVVLAFLISGLCTCITVLPMAQLSSALPTTGAAYRYSSRLLGPNWGFVWMVGLIVSKVTIALYALAFAQYLAGLLPSAPVKAAALIILTLFFIVNLVGVKSAAVVEKWMVVLKLIGLAVFIVWGISSVDTGSFISVEAMLPKGMDGMLQAIGILAFTSYGAAFVAEFGGEMKNPGRDIPLTIIIATIGSTIFYILIAFVASGILPVAEVANQPLSMVAKIIMPTPVFYFFMIGGALVALASAVNAVFAWVTKGMIIASQDGWLPKGMGAVNKKYGTPHYWLTFFYVIGAVTIISGISLTEIARIGFGCLLIIGLIPVLACAYLPKKYPEQYANAPFRIKPSILYPTIFISLIIMAGQTFYVMKGLPTNLQVITIGIILASVVYANIVGRRGQKLATDDGFSPAVAKPPESARQ